MLSLLTGLMFRPRETMQQLVQKPSFEQAARLNYLMLVLLMINTVFSVGIDPNFDKYLGETGKWIFALFYPPVQYSLHRLVYVISARFGLAMFSPKHILQEDFNTQAAKLQLVKMTFPYAVFPFMFVGIVSIPFGAGIGLLLLLIGLVYLFILPVHALKEIYGVSTTVAFWSPLFIQFLIFLFLGLVLLVVMTLLGVIGQLL